MFQRGQPKDAFFNMKALAPRPISTATEMFDTDFEDSEVEDNSPRISINSVSAYSTHRWHLLMQHRVEEGVRLHYPRSKKYIHQVQHPTSSMDSILIYRLRRSRLRGQGGHIYSEVHSNLQ